MTPQQRSYAAATPADIPTLKRLIHHAFSTPAEAADKWIEKTGVGEFRMVRDGVGGEAAACLLRIPMAQYFGGRTVPMLGVAAVAVAPEARGRGLARWMMTEFVSEAQREGFALGALYPSTQALYRSVGYEQAGYRFATKMPVNRIEVGTRGARVRGLLDGDDQAVRACYRAFASRFNGTLDRGGYCWERARSVRDMSFSGFGVENADGGLDGYLFMTQLRDAGTMEATIQVSDCAFLTGAAGLRLLGFLSDFTTTITTATICGAPLLPLLSLMDSHHAKTEKQDVWMLRILDVERALGERGYSGHVSTRLCLEVQDGVLPSNAGSWTMEVEGGRCRVSRGKGAGPAVRCTVNALGALYSGLYTASQAAVLGWVEGDTAALQTADAVFGGGGVPWMTDYF